MKKNKIIKFSCVLFLIFCKARSMEQENRALNLEEFKEFNQLMPELKYMVLKKLIYVSDSCKDALKNLYLCSLVNKEFAKYIHNLFLSFGKKNKILKFINRTDSVFFVLSNYNLFSLLKNNFVKFLNYDSRSIEQIFNERTNEKSITYLKELVSKNISDFDKLSGSLIRIYRNFIVLLLESRISREEKINIANKFFNVISVIVESFQESLIYTYIFEKHLYDCFDLQGDTTTNPTNNGSKIVILHKILELFKLNHDAIFLWISEERNLLGLLSNFFLFRNDFSEFRKPPVVILPSPEKELEDFFNICLFLDKMDQQSSFEQFLKNKKEPFVNWLLNKDEPNTLLTHCLSQNYFNVAKLILENIDIDQLEKKRIFYQVLNEKYSSESSGRFEIIKIFVSQSLDINFPDQDGTTLLMKSVAKDDLAIIEFLLKNGAQVDLQDNCGQTVLMRAISQNNRAKLDIIKTLFKYGASKTLNYHDNFGNCAKELAKDEKELKDFLEKQ